MKALAAGMLAWLLSAPLVAQVGGISPRAFGAREWRETVVDVASLPECTVGGLIHQGSEDGVLRYVVEESAVYRCADGDWEPAIVGAVDLTCEEEGELLVANELGFLVCSGLPDHEHTLSDVTDAGTAAARDVPAAGDAAATEVALGSDSRLTDAREPTAHAASHGEGGSDEVTLAAGQVTGLDDQHEHTSATASLSVGEAGEAHAEASTLTWDGCTVSVTDGVATITCEGGGVEVPGSGSELMYRVDGETLGAVPSTVDENDNLSFHGRMLVGGSGAISTAANDPTLTVHSPTNTVSAINSGGTVFRAELVVGGQGAGHNLRIRQFRSDGGSTLGVSNTSLSAVWASHNMVVGTGTANPIYLSTGGVPHVTLHPSGAWQHLPQGTRPSCDSSMEGTRWVTPAVAGVSATVYERCSGSADDPIVYAWETY